MEKYKASLVNIWFKVHTLSFGLWVPYCCTDQNLYFDARSNLNGNKRSGDDRARYRLRPVSDLSNFDHVHERVE